MLTRPSSLHTPGLPQTFTSFGALLLFLRRRARLRQRDLAIATGYSEAQIGRLENDQRLPDVAIVMAQFLPALGIEREPELAERLLELAREARRNDASAPDDAPAAVAQDNNDPVQHLRIDSELSQQSTPLFGREPEIARLSILLHTSGNRCVTLLGPGGIGKTRLAIAVTTHNAARFTDGVCAVALAGVAQAGLLASAIAQSLGLAAQPNGDSVAQLHAHLRDKHMLLILDNMEHLVDAADMLSRLLAAAPAVQLLATSRERLYLRGEITLDIAGLPLPPVGADADSLTANPAVALFCSSAQRLRDGGVPTLSNLESAARVCRLVVGLPLAIELAAGWAHLLSFEEIERELRQTLDFLATDMRDLPPRHRSLRAAFAHSWDLLAPTEQRALQRLSVFRGSFSREAASAVLDESPTKTLHTLSALANKSLLKRSDGVGASRFVLHELVRQYAAEYLHALSAEERDAHASHSHYYLELLHAHEQLLCGPEQVAALATLATEDDQLRAALQWLIAEGDLVALRRVIAPLSIWFEWSYAVQEGAAIFGQISTRLREIVPPAAHVAAHAGALTLALAHAGWFNFHATRFELALAQVREAHALAQQGADYLALGDTLLFLGSMSAETGDTSAALPLLLAAIRAYDTYGDMWHCARGAYRLGTLLQQTGEYVCAIHLLASGIERLRPIGDPRALALCLNRLGTTLALLGRHAEAQQCFDESFLFCATTRDQRSTASSLLHLGRVAQYRGDHPVARYFFYESLQVFHALNERSAIATVQALDGYSAVAEHDYAAARTAFDAAYQIVRDADMITIALLLLVGRAALDLANGATERAVEALTLALHHAASEQFTRDRAAHLLHQAVAHLTPFQFAAAEVRGRTASIAGYLAL